MSLTDREVRGAKPREQDYKLGAGRGLALVVKANGTKLWRGKYRVAGREKSLSIGVYPEVTLKDARDEWEDARRLLRNGGDPSAEKRARRRAGDGNTFEAVAREWFAKQKPRWAESHSIRIIRRLERDVFPYLGKMPVETISAPDVLSVVRRIEKRKAIETAHRAAQNVSQVMRFAIATGRATTDPTTALRGALEAKTVRHHAAITDPDGLGNLLREIDAYRGSSRVTEAALRMAPHVFVRPAELRRAEWDEIDLGDALWTIPSEKMKGRESHMVPLSRQVLAILEELHPRTSSGRFVFPNARTADRPMSENALLAALRGLGYGKDDVTPHGFRATARTLLDEALEFPPHLVEHQLAHSVRDALGRSYNRTKHLTQRRDMMQRWSDYLDELRDAKGKVVPLRGRIRA